MIDRINDIAWQARQGSVAAIIQLLNDKLAVSGVRTRAIFADGVLQILCEAPHVAQLEQSTLVEQIQHILNETSPRNIRRVNINCRIVREEQLLWLNEIYSNGEKQLLWSQEITLTQPNIVKKLIINLNDFKDELEQANLPKSTIISQEKRKNPPQTKILFAASLFILPMLGLIVYVLLGNKIQSPIKIEISKSLHTSNNNTQSNTQSEISLINSQKNDSVPTEESTDDAFVAAVRLANQASTYGKTATTATQWLELAATWQRASDLMAKVPSTHVRYQEAKIRTQLYKKYSETAQQEAAKSKS